jgi:hypothetical protein
MELLVPLFFFHVYDDIISHDDEGVDLPSLAAARLQAISGARDICAEQVRHGHLELSHWIDVVDESGAKVLTLTFREAVDVRQ